MNVKNRPNRPRGRQFSLQFSRQLSKGSIRSLPSPKGLGRHRPGVCQFQSRQLSGLPFDALQLPDPEHNHDFQGMSGAEEENKEGSDKRDDTRNQNSMSKSLEKM